MEEIILVSLFMGIALCISFTIIIVFRIYSRSDKFLKVKLENMNNDVNSLALENRRLRGAVNRSKQEPTLPDEIDSDNLGEVVMGILPKKYHKIARPLIPKLEQYLISNPETLSKLMNKVKEVNQDGNKQQQQIDSEALTTL
jgi:hypothetical protein